MNYFMLILFLASSLSWAIDRVQLVRKLRKLELDMLQLRHQLKLSQANPVIDRIATDQCLRPVDRDLLLNEVRELEKEVKPYSSKTEPDR